MDDLKLNIVCNTLFDDGDNDDWFVRSGQEVTKEMLLMLIEKSHSLHGVAGFLGRLLVHVNGEAVTDDVFLKIVGHPSRSTRRSLMVSLAHSRIAIYQLEYICSKIICPEAFCQLIDIMSTDNNFTVIDLKRLLDRSRKMAKEAVPIERYLEDERISMEKKDMLERWWKELEHAKNIHDL